MEQSCHCIKLTELNFLENDLSLSEGGNAKLCLILKITTDNLIFLLKKMSLHDHDFFNLCSVWDRECLLLQICESMEDTGTFILVILQ